MFRWPFLSSTVVTIQCPQVASEMSSKSSSNKWVHTTVTQSNRTSIHFYRNSRTDNNFPMTYSQLVEGWYHSFINIMLCICSSRNSFLGILSRRILRRGKQAMKSRKAKLSDSSLKAANPLKPRWTRCTYRRCTPSRHLISSCSYKIKLYRLKEIISNWLR